MFSFHFLLSAHFPVGFAIKSVCIRHFPSTLDDFIINEQANLSVYHLSRIPDKGLSISIQVTDTKQSYVCGFYATQTYAEVYQTEPKPYGGYK